MAGEVTASTWTATKAEPLLVDTDEQLAAAEAEFATFGQRARLSWRDLVSPPVGYCVDGPNRHPDIVCWVDGGHRPMLQISRSSRYWETGHWIERTVHSEPFAGNSVADALEAAARFADREGLGPVCAFMFGWAPNGDPDADSEHSVLEVWCGTVLDIERIPVAPRTSIPVGSRIRTGDALSLPVGRRSNNPTEVLDEHYRFVLEQDDEGEWTIDSGPTSAGREVHAHATGFETLVEVYEWGRGLWVKSFEDDEHFDAAAASLSVGVPAYRYRAIERPAFRVYVY